MSTLRMRAAAVLLALLVAAPAGAHGLLVKVRGEGGTVKGTVYYSDGRPGAGEWVQMFDTTDPRAAPVSMNAAPDGGFRFSGVEGRRYRIVVAGEEGHSVESVILLGGKARGTFVDRDAAPAEDEGIPVPPAWALIGGVLALSIVPALWLRRRRDGIRAATSGDPGAPEPAARKRSGQDV